MTKRPRALLASPWLAVAVLSLGQLIIVLDGTIVTVALPVIERELHFSQASLAWVSNAYLVTFAGLLLLAGRLGDLLGRKTVFLAGIALFTCASVLCGVSNAQGLLIGARFAQGVGAALSSSMVLGMLVTVFPDARNRGRAMGIYAIIGNAGGSIGLFVGGALTQALSWHWIFFVNVPIGIAAFVIAAIVLERHEGIGLRAGVDIPGAVLAIAVPTLVVYSFVHAASIGWGARETVAMLVGAAALGVVFVFVERRSTHPLIPLGVFQYPNLVRANIVRIFHGLGLSSMFFSVALYLENVLHLSPVATGIAFFPFNIVISVCSLLVVTKLVRRVEARRLVLPGFLLVALGFLLFTRVPVRGSVLTAVEPSLLLIGLGGSLVFMPTVSIAMANVKAKDSGFASGLVNVAMQTGGALGIALIASISAIVTRHALSEGRPPTAALVSGYHVAFLLGACFAATGGGLSLMLRRAPGAREAQDSARELLETAPLPTAEPS